MQQVKEQIAELSRKQACRPHEPQYGRLFQELQHYLCSIGQASRVEDLLSRLLKALQGSSKSRSLVQNLLKEETVWQNSQQRFCQRLLEDYPLYPDVVGPVRTGILQLRHGMRLVASQLAASLTAVPGLPKLVSCLLAFPSPSPSLPSYLARADFLCSTACMDVLRCLVKLLPQQDREQVVPRSSTLLLNALLLVQCHTLSTGEFSHEAHSLFRHICQVRALIFVSNICLTHLPLIYLCNLAMVNATCSCFHKLKIAFHSTHVLFCADCLIVPLRLW